jgi:hypothetical protein
LNESQGLEILIGMERAATQIKEFEIVVMPGLLQTRDYAMALLGELLPDEPERRQRAIDTRIKRQRILKELPKPQITAILDEAAVHRAVGGPAVLKGQLQHLITMIDAGDLLFHVIPFGAGAHVGMLNGFTMLEFEGSAAADAEPDISPVVYVENQTNTMYFDHPPEVAEYARAFTALRARSLALGDSRALLQSVQDQL